MLNIILVVFLTAVLSLSATTLLLIKTFFKKWALSSRYEVPHIKFAVRSRDKDLISDTYINSWDEAYSHGLVVLGLFAVVRRIDRLETNGNDLAILYDPLQSGIIKIGLHSDFIRPEFYLTIEDFLHHAHSTRSLSQHLAWLNSTRHKLTKANVASSCNALMSKINRNNWNKAWNSDKFAGLRRDDLLPQILSVGDVNSLPEGGYILDAMCGFGKLGLTIEKRLEKEKIKAFTLFLDSEYDLRSRFSYSEKFVWQSIFSLRISDNFFDRAFLRFGLYDLSHQMQLPVIKELWRVTKSGGRITLVEICAPNDELKIHYNRLANLRDASYGHKGFNRYFPTKKECLMLLSLAGFKEINVPLEFSGTMHCTVDKRDFYGFNFQAKEETALTEYIQSLSEEMKKKLDLVISEKEFEFKLHAAVLTAIK